MPIQTIVGNKIETTEMENMSSDIIEIKDSFNMNNHDILSVNNINTSNINLSTINGVAYSSNLTSTSLDTNYGNYGKYSQINGDVIIHGDNTSSTNAKSIISGTGLGSLNFSLNELSNGSSYHIKIAGSISTKNQRKINISCYLGTTIIYSTSINTDDIIIENLNSDDYAYESEIDFTIHSSGSNGKIYSNGQLLYTKGTAHNNLRGNSSEKTVNGIDLSNNLLLDIKIYWDDFANSDESLTNKMVRITKMF